MTIMNDQETLKSQACDLNLHGLLSQWDKLISEQILWLTQFLQWELSERKQRSLERRLSSAKLGHFELINEFDWSWPTKID